MQREEPWPASGAGEFHPGQHWHERLSLPTLAAAVTGPAAALDPPALLWSWPPSGVTGARGRSPAVNRSTPPWTQARWRWACSPDLPRSALARRVSLCGDYAAREFSSNPIRTATTSSPISAPTAITSRATGGPIPTLRRSTITARAATRTLTAGAMAAVRACCTTSCSAR